MNEQFSIAGKVAVITGAGGVLGGSIAKCFMQQGAKVVAVDIRQEQLDKRVEELKTYGEDVIGIVGNVLDIASLEKLADDIVAKWGRIDILLNIAGGNMPGATLAPDQHFYDMDISCWEKVTNLNMNGTVYPSLVFSKVMAKQGKDALSTYLPWLLTAPLRAFRVTRQPKQPLPTSPNGWQANWL